MITGLLRKRQEIADELEIIQGRLRKPIRNIDAVDATTKPFQPDMNIGIVRVRPTPRRHTALRGESSRLILNMLREAGGAMTTRDVVLKIMEARGLNIADRPMHETMRMRVSASLRGPSERGTIKSSEGKGASVLWQLAAQHYRRLFATIAAQANQIASLSSSDFLPVSYAALAVRRCAAPP